MDNNLYKDDELLVLIAEGDEAAFHELVNRYADLLHTFIYRITEDRQLTQELVQDTFVKIWLSRETLIAVQNFRAYLFTVSKNFAIKAAQKALKERMRFEDWKKTWHDDETDSEWKFALIDEAIARLPPQQYKVWIMSRRQGKKYTEIADELGLSRESVKKYLQYANASILDYVKGKIDLPLFIAAALNMFS